MNLLKYHSLPAVPATVTLLMNADKCSLCHYVYLCSVD